MISLDDAKISFIRNKSFKMYQDLKSDDEKAQFRQRLADSITVLRAWAQGAEMAHTIESDEASEERREEIRKADSKYIPKKQPKAAPKGLEKFGINLGALLAEIDKLPNKKG